ncbi:transcription factor A, mitochondrial-like [Engraulis encrasicolus]|uniref:transcription factor A, mitochondrial-like n=1 Tax=Engraulis encrasicolus TaxID=184585 RepID=UPI002FD64A3E
MPARRVARRAAPSAAKARGEPKRPLNAYMRFGKQERPEIVRQYPNIETKDIVKKVASKWRGLTPAQKQPFQAAALAEMAKYKLRMKRYKAGLTPSRSRAIEEQKQLRRAKRGAIKMKRELQRMGKPKRPRQPFNLFMAENYGTPVDVKSLHNKWRRLPTLKKKAYVQRAEDDKARYAREMSAWERNMMDMGRPELVRKKSAPKTATKPAAKAAPARTRVAKPKTVRRKRVVAKKRRVVKNGARKTRR